MARDHAPRIKDGTLYDALVARGDSPEKAARIANAHAAGTLHHDAAPLEDRTRAALEEEAKWIGIVGRSGMNKEALVAAIRGHG